MKRKGTRYLMVGACGMGVAPMALFLAERGEEVFGYDDHPVPVIRKRLESAGVHWLDHLHGTLEIDTVVLSRAIAYDKDKVDQLHQRFPDAKFYYRGEFLAEIARNHRTVAIVGSHGKTTTTAMLVHALRHSGFPCSHILGGFFQDEAIPAGKYAADSVWLVIEVDESDRTIALFSPEITVVTNLDLDHADAYRDEAALVETFRDLLGRSTGQIVLGSACPAGLEQGTSTPSMRLPARNGCFREYNADLAHAATKVIFRRAGSCCQPRRESCLAVRVERRQDIRELPDGRVIVRDYAHHPSELAALVAWVREQYPQAKVVWVFQPHRYTRTRALMQGFVEVLRNQETILLPEYAAFEPVDPVAGSDALGNALQKAGGSATVIREPEKLATTLQSNPATVWVFAGAGDIPLWADWVEERCLPTDPVEDRVAAVWVRLHRRLLGPETILETRASLKRKVTLLVGGHSRFYAEPENSHALQLLRKSAGMLGLDYRILGNGSNLLVDDAGFDGLVIRLSQPYWRRMELIGNGRIWVGAGVSLKLLSRFALENGLAGFNFYDGIPGSVGGALWMNAGAMGSETSERVVAVDVMEADGRLSTLTPEQLGFGYRHSSGLRGRIVLGAVMQGRCHDTPCSLSDELAGFRARRHASQPSEPSAGCMFKNPMGDSAGRLIDLAGLKGHRIGGARISEKHANFLVTEKGASSEDVRQLMEDVRERVRVLHQVELQPEIEWLGGGR